MFSSFPFSDALDMLDFADILDVGVFSSLASLAALWIVLGIVLIGIYYFFGHYTLMCAGRKAGLTSDWMAYVPIARDIYELKIVRAPIWQLFFFKFTGLLSIALLDLICIAIFKPDTWLVLCIIFTCAWLIVSIYVLFTFYYAYYRGVHFNPLLAFLLFISPLYIVMRGLDIYIAFRNDVYFGNSAQPSSMPRSASAPVQMPSGGRITAVAGSYKDAVFTLRDMEEISFGRDGSECQVVFDQFNTDISRKHCTVRYNGVVDKYVVTDYSKNGTYLFADGKRLQTNEPVTLHSGTVIYLGSKKNVFRLG